jgi:putative peptidoglycan lipid II flippase
MAVQFAKERFLVPAMAPLIYNIGIISGGFLLGRWMGMVGFAWGVLAGAFLGSFVLQLWGAGRVGMVLSPAFDWRHPDLRKYLWLSLPLMFGLTMTFSTEFFLKFFGSFLPRGQIAGLNYGQRVMLLLVAFFGQAVGTASFPFLARLAAEGKKEALNRLLDTTLRYLALVIPLAVLVMVLRTETVVILFQRGRFDTDATVFTSQALGYLMIGAAAFAAMTVVVRGFYAMQDTLFPAVFTTLAVLASIPLYLFGMHHMGVRGVALASSLAAILQTTLLYVLWKRKSGNPGGREVGGAYLKAALVSVPLGLGLEALRRILTAGIDISTFGGSLAVAAIVGAVFTAILLGAGYLLRIDEITVWVKRLGGKSPGSGNE